MEIGTMETGSTESKKEMGFSNSLMEISTMENLTSMSSMERVFTGWSTDKLMKDNSKWAFSMVKANIRTQTLLTMMDNGLMGTKKEKEH